MKFNKKYIYFFLSLFLAVSAVNSSAKVVTETLEWKVKEGDSMTYTISKFFELADSDGNGDPESTTLSIQNEDGEIVNITFGKGSKFTTKITALNGVATTQTTYGSTVVQESTVGGVVMKTVDNKSYWEEYASERSGGNKSWLGLSSGSVKVEGNYVVTSSFLDMNGTILESIVKVNWKTGWYEYTFSKSSNSTHTISEMEVTSGSSSLTRFEIIPIIGGLFIIALVVSRKRW